MKPGTVFLVGAGPGDPGLVTLKGARCIESADVIVYDRLVSRQLLDHARPGAGLIDAGKVPGGGGSTQDSINSLLVSTAKQGKTVVRLKGGDPFVFGRGGEEAEALCVEGIPFEVVPGVTSAIAAPAYAGIPLTDRRLASSFTVVTGSQATDKLESQVQWSRLAKQEGTLVVLMGWRNLRDIVENLLEHGRPASEPVALIQWGTKPRQTTVVGTLSDIVDRAAMADLSPPVVAVIGPVVNLRERLRWFDNRPLFGKRVLVTRTRAQAGELSSLLRERGADAIELPAIETHPMEDFGELDRALGRVNSYDWVIFTSVNAVGVVFERLDGLGVDARAFGQAKVGAIGPSTAASLRQRGIVADLVPDTFTSDAVIEGLKAQGFTGGHVLLPRADIAGDALREGLSALGAKIDDVAAYRTVAAQDSTARAKDILSEGVDIATFTSSSTVTNLSDLVNGNLDGLSRAIIACIGPVTAATAREIGLKVDIVAREHTIAGLVEALESNFTPRSPHISKESPADE